VGRTKANRREPKSGLGQVFNFKLGHFVMKAIAQYIQTLSRLELKTWPKFCPFSLSLFMAYVIEHLLVNVNTKSS
jgi:hypothetical protein